MSMLSIAAQIALVLLGALAAGGIIWLLVLMRQIRRIGREFEKRAGPLLDRSTVVAANLEYITAQVRTDVERLNGSVEGLTRRLNQASEHMEDRIEEFNALMEVVQGEAEGVFLETAATVRGIRAGARELTAGDARRDGTASDGGPPGGRGPTREAVTAAADAREPDAGGDDPDGARERSA